MAFKNYYHPLQEVYTLQYGWMPIDRLYEKYASKQKVSIANYDINTTRFPYTDNYEVTYARVRSCTYLYGDFQGSEVQFNVHPDCLVMVSLDGGETLEFLTAKEIHDLQKEDNLIKFVNLKTISDIRKSKDEIRFFTEQVKKNYTFNNGLVYGIKNETGAIVSRYNGRITVLGTDYIEGV